MDSVNLKTEPYLSQVERWPKNGRHVLAQFDADSIVVYQAYRPSIGRYAADHQRFGGEWSLHRMSWIKPNFLWMMARSDWGTAEGQHVVLAVKIRRPFFEEILRRAVPTAYTRDLYRSEPDWKKALAESPVRMQWDPDHDPTGAKLDRRAIQLGLSGDLLARYSQAEIMSIEDISDFVAEQRAVVARKNWPDLRTPREEVYAAEERRIYA